MFRRFHLFQRQFAFGLRHPRGAIAYAIGGRESFLRWKDSFEDQQFVSAIRRLTGTSKLDIKHLRSELAVSGLDAQMEEAIQEKGLSVLPADKLLGRHPSLLTLNQIYGSAPYGWFYYVLFRLLKPSTVVETGVWYGVSTAFILQALEHNGNGTLYSIDLPNPNYVGRVENTGALVPNALRSRWSLILGKTQERLIPLLEKLGSIDAFICDSDHTYECMMFEFSTAWRFLTPGGVLISDDVHWNKAFTDFTRSQNLRPIIFQRKLFSTLFPSGERMGAILKPSTPRTHTV